MLNVDYIIEHRVEIGDIDTDWYEDDRQKVYDYIINRFGTQKTGYVLAMGTLADKSVIDMLGKAFRVKYKDNTIYTLDKIAEIKKEYEKNPENVREEYSDLFYYYGACKLNKATYSSDLCKQLLNMYVKEGNTVYDCFMGSGTTAIACEELGMNCYGSEISEAQVEYSRNRLEEFRKNKNV